MSAQRLAGKVAIITGGGSGLGRACALMFSSEGASVVVADVLTRRSEATAKLVEQAGGIAVAMTVDVRMEDDVASMVDQTLQRLGAVDIMFANAGVSVAGNGRIPIWELTFEQFQAVCQTNLAGVFLCCKHAARVMKDRGGGVILCTSSAASLVAYPGMAAYSATKAGVNGLVRGLAFDLGPFGIRINAICPTHGMSPNFLMDPEAEVVGCSYEEAAGSWDPSASPIPLRMMRPPSLSDNANAALFLVSDESAFMSGVCLPSTDGGTLSRVAMHFDPSWREHLIASVGADPQGA